MLRLYNASLIPVRAVSALWAAWCARDKRRAIEWSERRLKVLPRVPAGGVWLHGSSVGEARIVSTLARRLREARPSLPLAVSAHTRSGREQLPRPPVVDASFFSPLDFPGLPGQLLDAARPATLVLIETELWPNLLHETFQRGIPVAVVNGRLSPRRMPRYRRLSSLYRPLLGGLARVGAQSQADAERFSELGVRESALVVTGNIKYDLPVPGVDRTELRRRFGLQDGRPTVVAGSTGSGEEEPVLAAVEQLRLRFPRLFLILAPRHVERAGEVDRLARARGLRLHRLSSGDDGWAAKADGLLVDTIGELASLYAIAGAAFVGGSLVPIGGHNVLEPAVVGAPVLFGPHTDHVAEPAEALLRANGAIRVAGPDELAREWASLLGDPERRRRMASNAAGVLRTNRGALERSLSLIDSLLDGRTA